ncbi:MAG: hypothetical protein H6934_07265 [Burkholderiaceae bacterium]|nr:hypothetical protein [Burkholderiaceae bacterium]
MTQVSALFGTIRPLAWRVASLGAILAGLAATLSPVHAAAFEWDVSTEVWVATMSGRAGTAIEARSRWPTRDGAYQIVGYEDGSDRPTRFRVSWGSIDPNTLDGDSSTIEIPGQPYNALNAAMTVNIGADRVATAIQVCLNNDRIKGLRLWGKAVGRDGTLGNSERKSEARRNNCHDSGWSARVGCGTKKAISALRFHKRSDGKNKWSFSGISIACSRIR